MQLITPVSSAFIGYLTNKLAIKMLFRPKNSYFGVQGLLIKRKAEIAKSLSDVIVDRLVASGIDNVMPEEKLRELINVIADDITESLVSETCMSSDSSPAKSLKAIIVKELYTMTHTALPKTSDAMNDLKKTVQENIIAIPDTELEVILTDIAAKEFVAIEILGGVVGLIVGLANMTLLNM